MRKASHVNDLRRDRRGNFRKFTSAGGEPVYIDQDKCPQRLREEAAGRFLIKEINKSATFPNTKIADKITMDRSLPDHTELTHGWEVVVHVEAPTKEGLTILNWNRSEAANLKIKLEEIEETFHSKFGKGRAGRNPVEWSRA